ncbi:divalent metal cation transporter [Candidatus Parcubacteria bacterium]|nr:MAG: divalent metal cation transporter [Candidatus Parcubacteria bacterium]
MQKIIKSLGPGFITGAADDDPSGIGTYSQTGGLFGYSQLWLAPYSLPFMIAVQEMCGRIGAATGKGLSGVMREHYPRPILWGAVVLLLIANTINIGADLGAMAESINLIVPLPAGVSLAAITVFTLALQILVPYPTYARFLKYLALSLLSYVVAAFVVQQDWPRILWATFVPHIELSSAYLLNITAMLGTTISPYLFFWQADEEVEEEIEKGKLKEIGKGTPKITARFIREMRVDTAVGMTFSQLVMFFIIATVATTISVTEVTSAAQAAEALRPIAGDWAFFLFALGIISTGLLAVPVLAGSAAFAVAEAAHWKVGLEKKFDKARMFYGVIVVSTLVGLLVNALPIDPITLLYYAAAINGLLAPPLLIIILLIANSKKILGHRTNSPLSNLFGIAITAIMSLIALSFLFVLLF